MGLWCRLFKLPKGIRVICSKVANRRMHQDLAICDFASENQDEINRHLKLLDRA